MYSHHNYVGQKEKGKKEKSYVPVRQSKTEEEKKEMT